MLLRHAQNRGKGAAIRTGLEHATGSIVLIQDADHEYDPSDYPVLVEPIQRGETRVVYGSRFQGSIVGMQLANRAANKVLSLMASALGPSHITDEATCFKVFDASLLKAMPLRCRRFEFCPEVTGLLQGMGEAIVEVPITVHRPGPGRGQEGAGQGRGDRGGLAPALAVRAPGRAARPEQALPLTDRMHPGHLEPSRWCAPAGAGGRW